MLDIWTIDLKDLSPEASSYIHSLLTPAERDRAQRYASQAKRQSFALARGIVRDVLSRYVALPAQDLVFTLTSRGKPELDIHNQRAPFFNLSHSQSYVCLAVSLNRRVGVDIEVMDKDLPKLDKIASFAFAPPEVEALATYPPALRVHSFYTLWTSKEAYAKGTGEGLSRLRSISCRIRYGPSSLQVQGIHGAPDWRLHHFQPVPHIQGTAAVEGKGSVLITYSSTLMHIKD